MRHSTWGRMVLVTSLVLGWLATAAPAVEQAQDFLDRLRERGYHDLALDYLDWLRTSPLCPKEMKDKLDYELGVTLIGASPRAGTLTKREQYLDQARDTLEKFIKENPKHPLAGTASSQCANVLVERGRIKAELAASPNKSADEKKRLLGEARTLYQEAQKIFETSEKFWYEVAKKFEGRKLDSRKDSADVDQRDQARRELVQARLFLAQVMYEIAKTCDAGSKERTDWLTKSAAKYAELFQKYGQLIGGLYAHMWEGRIYIEMGQYDKAITALKDLLVLPDEPDAFRILKMQSMGYLMEAYVKAKKYQEAVTEVEKWEKDARAEEESSEEGLKIHFFGGVASLELEKTLKEDAKKKAAKAAAKAHFDRVARFRGDFQRDAQARLAELQGVAGPDAAEPTDYDGAKERGDFHWSNMVLAMGQLQQAKTAADQKKANEQLATSSNEALKYYRLAIELKRADVSVDEVNLIRFRMAFLYWSAQDLQRAALVGEFLARRYPSHVGARKGAEIAVKAYRKMFTDALAAKQDTAFETARLTQMALYVTGRWPNEAEAEEAWTMLIDTAVDNRDVPTAMQYLEKIPTDSPKRAQAELRTGEALWRAYAQAANLQGADRPPQEQLDKMVQQAQSILEQGIERMRKSVESGGDVSYSLVYCVLSLANIYVGTGQPEKAVAMLDDAKIGPMTLIKAKSPILEGHELFVEAVYNVALQAYVGVQQLDKAEETMHLLEAAVGEGGGEKLTLMYIRLGKQLEETLVRLRNDNKMNEAKKVAGGFEVFLTKIADRKEGNTFASLYWVAETFFSMGSASSQGGKASEDEAQQYFKKAAGTYLAIIKRIKEDPKFAPAGSEMAIKVRLAICLRDMGKFEEALKLLVAILKEKENRLDIQKEVAAIYQKWGATKPTYYENAIKGSIQDGRYLVWGYGGIAKRVMAFLGTNKKYEDMFHECRFKLAECRYDLARSQGGTQKKATLEQAERDISAIYRLYPSMGGPEWFARYDELLGKIQNARGVKVTGLKGLEQAAPPAKAKTSATNTASAK